MQDIKDLAEEMKKEAELIKFAEVQHKTITDLLKRIDQLETENAHLKDLISNAMPIIGENRVEQVILTPEEGLIESQLNLIANNSIGQELTLEDVKKMDLLLKNKLILKEKRKEERLTIESSSKKIDKKNLTTAQLIQIAASKKNDNHQQ